MSLSNFANIRKVSSVRIRMNEFYEHTGHRIVRIVSESSSKINPTLSKVLLQFFK